MAASANASVYRMEINLEFQISQNEWEYFLMTRPKSYEWEYGMSHGKNQPIIERSDANSEFP